MAKVIGISPANSKASTTAYDPTCGSGSLLLKVSAEAGKHITLEGQEKDVTTAGARTLHFSEQTVSAFHFYDKPTIRDLGTIGGACFDSVGLIQRGS